MINEEVLKKAVAEADQAIRDSLPAPEQCEHEFSLSFQRKMRRIVRRAKHPVLYQLPRYAACFVLAALLAGGTWLTIDAEARTAFFAWVREQYESYVAYRFIGEAPQETSVAAYELTWLPNGFYLVDAQVMDGITLLNYADDAGQQINFSVMQGSGATSLFLTGDYGAVQSVQVGSGTADFYEASQAEHASGLVWVSGEENLCFCITAPLPKDTLIKLAEGVQKK